jgi:hypothetical protein
VNLVIPLRGLIAAGIKCESTSGLSLDTLACHSRHRAGISITFKNVPAEKVGMFFFVALFGTPIGGPPNGVLFGTLSGELLKNYIYYS